MLPQQGLEKRGVSWMSAHPAIVPSRFFRNSIFVVLLCVQSFSSQLLTEPAAADSPSDAPAENAALSSRERIARDLRYLSSDELKGRDTGSPEIDLAAQYIAGRFDSLGFNTKLFGDTPFQEFTALKEVVPGPAEQNGLTFTSSEDLPKFVMGKSFMPLALGSSGTVSAPVVFVGYGITAPDQNYDDYAGIDVAGKIAVVLRGEPRRGRKDSPFGRSGSSRHAFFATKVQNAIDHGAAGLLMLNHAEATSQNIEDAKARLERQKSQLEEITKKLADLPEAAKNSEEKLVQARELMTGQLEALEAEAQSAPEALLSTNQAGQTEGDKQIPVASIGRQTFDQLLSKLEGLSEAQATVAAIEAQIDEDLKPISFELSGLTGELSSTVVTEEIRAKNVIAEMPGSGPLANETIVIGAHYDHVGMGAQGSLAPGTLAIHNGADDNGSGTVTMLELAYRLSQSPPENRRRIVFMAFTAEERGLLGSKHYAREPRFALEDTAAMINLDMVGRLSEEDGLTVFGTGTAPTFDALVDELNQSIGLKIRKDPSGFGPSDHTSFYEKGIPVLFFFTGLHSDYHRPSDDFHKINLDGMVQITDIAYEAAKYLATVTDRPQYQKTGPGQGVGRQRKGPYLGVQLDERGGQVFVTEPAAEGPAAIAGIRPGDELLKIGDKPTSSIKDVQDAVQDYVPGDKVPVIVSRAGDEFTLEVQLIRRP